MPGRKISVDSELYQQLKKCSEQGGYATPEEFAVHVLEKEVDRLQGGGIETTQEAIQESPPEPEHAEVAPIESSEPEQPSESAQ